MTTQLYTGPITLPVGSTTVKYAALVNGALTTTSTAVYQITNPTFAVDSLTSAATIGSPTLIIKKSTVRLVHLGAGSGGISKDIYGTTRNLRIYHSNQWITPT